MCIRDRLGGDDFDDRVIEWLVSEFKRETGIDLSKDNQAMSRLKEAAEKAKIELSGTQSSQINLPFITMKDGNPEHLDMTLSRARFEDLIAKHIEDTMAPTRQAMKDAGVAQEMIPGLLAAQTHYGQIDTETYRLNVMQALDIAEGKLEAATTPPPTLNLTEAEDVTEQADEDLRSVVLECIQAMDNGEGVDFESLVRNLAARGFSRDKSETELDAMSDEGILHEPRFGWFKIVS